MSTSSTTIAAPEENLYEKFDINPRVFSILHVITGKVRATEYAKKIVYIGFEEKLFYVKIVGSQYCFYIKNVSLRTLGFLSAQQFKDFIIPESKEESSETPSD